VNKTFNKDIYQQQILESSWRTGTSNKNQIYEKNSNKNVCEANLEITINTPNKKKSSTKEKYC